MKMCHDRWILRGGRGLHAVMTVCLFGALVWPREVLSGTNRERAAIDGGAVSRTAPLRVGVVTISVRDIYGRRELESSNGLVRFVKKGMNALHPSTHRAVIAREILFHTGDPLDPALLAETERNLRSLGYLTNVVVAPQDTLPDGTVPVEVRVQETWSLQMELRYSKSSGSQQWNAEVSDQNFLGYGVGMELGAGENEDRDFRLVGLHQRRLPGTSWRLDARYVDQSDGDRKELLLARAFYRQDDPWGMSMAGRDYRSRSRFYLPDTGWLRTGQPTGRLYARLPVRDRRLDWQWLLRVSPAGRGRIWRLGLGAEWRQRTFGLGSRVTLSSGVSVSDDSLRTVLQPALGRESGETVAPLLVIESQGRRWSKQRDIQRYGTVEDLPLDPILNLRTGPALGVLGGDRRRWLLEWRARDWSRLAGGHALWDFSGRGALGSSRNRTVMADLLLAWYDHPGRSWVVKLFAEGAAAEHLLGSDAYVLGLTRGLRTLEYDGRAGDRLWRCNAETAYLVPGELLGFYRLGLAAYVASGDAWWRRGYHAVGGPRHEVGVGLRFGPTRSARAEIARLDLTWSLDGGSPVVTAATGGQF